MKTRLFATLFATLFAMVLAVSTLATTPHAAAGEPELVVDIGGAGRRKPAIRLVDETRRTAIELRFGDEPNSIAFALDPVIGPGTSGRLPYPVTSRPCASWRMTVTFDDGVETTGEIDPCRIRTVTIRDETEGE